MSAPRGRFDSSGLLQARVASGLSRAELAERLGTISEVVQQWEDGESTPTVRNLLRIAKALDLEVSDLYQLESPESSTLADLRVAAGLSQRQLAKRIGTSQARISYWERARETMSWANVEAYSRALGVPATAVGQAVDETHKHHGVPVLPRPASKPEDFRADKESPHLNILEDGPGSLLARVTSPQFPRLDMKLRAEGFSMAELAVINEHMGADTLHRFNHGQRREEGQKDTDATYLIRWQLDMHDGLKRYAEIPNILFHIPRWRQDPGTAPQHQLPTGEYLLIVVDAQDPLWWVSNQLAAGESATLIPNYPRSGSCVVTAVGKNEAGELSILSSARRHSLAELGLDLESAHRELTEAVRREHLDSTLDESDASELNDQAELFDSYYCEQLANPRP